MDWGQSSRTRSGFIGEPFIYFSLAAMGRNMHKHTGLLVVEVFMAAGA